MKKGLQLINIEGKNTPLSKEIAWSSGAPGILDVLQWLKFHIFLSTAVHSAKHKTAAVQK